MLSLCAGIANRFRRNTLQPLIGVCRNDRRCAIPLDAVWTDSVSSFLPCMTLNSPDLFRIFSNHYEQRSRLWNRSAGCGGCALRCARPLAAKSPQWRDRQPSRIH
jgi:hypothetical protein